MVLPEDGLFGRDPIVKVVRVVNSIDPNEKFGPDGMCAPIVKVPADKPVTYTVSFGNCSGSSQAAGVVVTDVIHPLFDISTLQPLSIHLNEIVPDPGGPINGYRVSPTEEVSEVFDGLG